MAIKQPTFTEIDRAAFDSGRYTFPVESIIEPERGFGKLTIRASEGWLVATGVNPEPRPVQELGHIRQPDGSRLVRETVTVTFTGSQPATGTITLSNTLQEVHTLTIVGRSEPPPLINHDAFTIPPVENYGQRTPPPLPDTAVPESTNTTPVTVEALSRPDSYVEPEPVGQNEPAESVPKHKNGWLIWLVAGITAIMAIVFIYRLQQTNPAPPVTTDNMDITDSLIKERVGNYAFRLKRNATDSLTMEGTARIESHHDGTYWLMGTSPDHDLRLEYQCSQVSKDDLLLAGEFSYADSPTSRAHGVSDFHLYQQPNRTWLSVASGKLPGLMLIPAN